MKEKKRQNLRKKLNKMEINNLLDKKFKIMFVNMLTKLGWRMAKFRENFKNETENIKKEPTRSEE